MSVLEVFWSFRSPYSYLAIDRLLAIRDDYEVDMRFRPVRPLALREPDFFERGRSQFLPYLFRDVPREAERLGIAFALPQPDPIDMDLTTGVVAPNQPLFDRVISLSIAAIAAGKGIEFAQGISEKIWTGQPWADDDALAAVCASNGVALSDLDAWITEHKSEIDTTIAANEEEQLKHHWGVPLMIFNGEPFFGQDRMDSLFWRLDQQGLKR